MRPSAALLGRNSWPVRPLAVFFGSTNGPIQDHQQHISRATMGPSDTIGSMSLEGHWVHSKSSAAFLWSNAGPMAHIHLLLPMALLHLGFYRLLGMIFFLILVRTLIIYSMRFFTSSASSSSTNLSIAPIKISSLLDKLQIALSIQ